jgi:hypothetical protein
MTQLPNVPELPSPDEVRKSAKPWDLLNEDIGRVSPETAEERMSICSGCDMLFKFSKQCRKCGCHMPWKTLLPNAECPLGKWGQAPKASE